MVSHGRIIASMRPLKATAVFVVAAGLATLPSCSKTPSSSQETGSATSQPAAENRAAGDVDLEGMDRAILPGDDFFHFANGAWLKKTEIPPDRSSYGVWSVLIEQAQQRTRDLLMAAADGKSAAGSDDRKVGDYYAAYMDEAAVESRGTAPLKEPLEKIAAIADRRALAAWLGQGIRADVDPLNYTNFYTDHIFGLWVSQDLNDPAHYAAYLLQGGLGMPDRDYYTDAAPRMEQMRTAYRAHIATMLKLAGIAEPDRKADRIVALEKRIAAAHATRTESSDVLKGNNPWKREEFDRRAPGMDWAAFFTAARLQNTPQFIVWQPRAVTGIAALVGSEPLDTWRDYLAFHAIDHHAGVLPRAFADERFAFYGKTLSGREKQRERWERGVDLVNRGLGEAIGQVYVKRHFPPESKAKIDALVANLIAAYKANIETLAWMVPATRAKALVKMSTLRPKIGYPG